MSIFLCTVKCLTHTHRIWAGLWSAWTNRMQQKWCCASSKPGLRRPCWLLLLSGPWMPPCEQAQANLLEDETMWSRGDRPILDHPKPAYSQLLPSRRQICTQTEDHLLQGEASHHVRRTLKQSPGMSLYRRTTVAFCQQLVFISILMSKSSWKGSCSPRWAFRWITSLADTMTMISLRGP